jgi:hypothetical protein
MDNNRQMLEALPPVLRNIKSLLRRLVFGQLDTQAATADGDAVNVALPLALMGGYDMTLGTGKPNQVLHVTDDTGAAVLTVTGGFNASGNNTLTFAATGGGAVLASDSAGAWTLVSTYGGTASTV